MIVEASGNLIKELSPLVYSSNQNFIIGSNQVQTLIVSTSLLSTVVAQMSEDNKLYKSAVTNLDWMKDTIEFIYY